MGEGAEHGSDVCIGDQPFQRTREKEGAAMELEQSQGNEKNDKMWGRGFSPWETHLGLLNGTSQNQALNLPID